MTGKSGKTINIGDQVTYRTLYGEKKSVKPESVWYDYEVNVGTGCATGSILVSEDATDDEIRLAIMNDLYDVSYHRQEPSKEEKV